MSLTAKKAKDRMPLIPEGYHKAVISNITDLGEQKNEFDGEVKWQSKAAITFTLPELIVDGEEGKYARTFNKVYTISTHKKSNLRPILVGLGMDVEGDFSLEKLSGLTCEINILHEKNDQNEEFAKLVKAKPAQFETDIKPRVFLIPDEDQDKAFKSLEFNTLPEWQVEAIKKSREYNDLPF